MRGREPVGVSIDINALKKVFGRKLGSRMMKVCVRGTDDYLLSELERNASRLNTRCRTDRMTAYRRLIRGRDGSRAEA